MTAPEVAESLGVSVATVERDWRLARAWLAGQLGGGDGYDREPGRRRDPRPGRLQEPPREPTPSNPATRAPARAPSRAAQESTTSCPSREGPDS
jgi:ECF sigma factor